MKKIICLLLAVVCCAFAFSGCGEKTDWAYIQDKGEMVMGITLFQPMNYYADDNNTELVGFETEFAKAVCDKLGVKAKFQEINWTTKETELSSKSIDCIWNGMTITDERSATMDISTPYMSNKQVLVTKTANAKTYTTADALKDKVVVAEKESAGEEVIGTDDMFKQAKYTAVDTMSKALTEVKAGTADACVIDYITSLGSLGEGTDYADLSTVSGAAFADEQYGIAFRKDSPETLKKVNEAIQQIADDGTLETIAKKYKVDGALLIKAK